MLLFSIFVVVLDLFETSATYYCFTGSRDVLNVHLTPHIIWTGSDGTALNRDKFFSSSRQLWKRNKFDAVSTNESSSDEGDEGHTNIYVCLEQNGGDCLGTCKSVIRGGKSIDLLEYKVQFTVRKLVIVTYAQAFFILILSS